MVSLLCTLILSRPGIGGIAAREPVAMTIRRARTRADAEVTVRESAKLARSRITVTPKPSKRSWASFGAITAMTPLTCAFTASQSTCGSIAAMPKRAASRIACAACAAAISAFEGTQP